MRKEQTIKTTIALQNAISKITPAEVEAVEEMNYNTSVIAHALESFLISSGFEVEVKVSNNMSNQNLIAGFKIVDMLEVYHLSIEGSVDADISIDYTGSVDIKLFDSTYNKKVKINNLLLEFNKTATPPITFNLSI